MLLCELVNVCMIDSVHVGVSSVDCVSVYIRECLCMSV